MRKKIAMIMLLMLLAFPGQAMAAGFNFDIHLSRTEDGTAYTEILYNNRVLWKISLLTDGARPAASIGEDDGIIIAPDLENGMFVLRICQ